MVEDLLSNKKDLKIYEDKSRGIIVQDLTEITVDNPYDIYHYLEQASSKRKTAATKMNDHSSRSHAIFTITVTIKQAVEEGDLIRTGKLNLVDLAGSECQAKTNADSLRAAEAKKINQSLLTLGRVITALVEGQPHVPYRDSNLTRLLKESLGGKNMSCIIATFSPSYNARDETTSTLEYATRAKSIKNQPSLNQRLNRKAEVMKLEKEMRELERELERQVKSSGIRIPEDEYNAMLEKIKLQDEDLMRRANECQLLDNELNMIDNDLSEIQNQAKNRENELDEEKEKERQLYNESQMLLMKIKNSMEEIDRLLLNIERHKQIDNSNHEIRQKIFENMSQKYIYSFFIVLYLYLF